MESNNNEQPQVEIKAEEAICEQKEQMPQTEENLSTKIEDEHQEQSIDNNDQIKIAGESNDSIQNDTVPENTYSKEIQNEMESVDQNDAPTLIQAQNDEQLLQNDANDQCQKEINDTDDQNNINDLSLNNNDNLTETVVAYDIQPDINTNHDNPAQNILYSEEIHASNNESDNIPPSQSNSINDIPDQKENQVQIETTQEDVSNTDTIKETNEESERNEYNENNKEISQSNATFTEVNEIIGNEEIASLYNKQEDLSDYTLNPIPSNETLLNQALESNDEPNPQISFDNVKQLSKSLSDGSLILKEILMKLKQANEMLETAYKRMQ